MKHSEVNVLCLTILLSLKKMQYNNWIVTWNLQDTSFMGGKNGTQSY